MSIHLPSVRLSHIEMEYASCMCNVLTAVDSDELVALLEQSRLANAKLSEEAEKEAFGEGILSF